ncbi:hypothetical protein BH11BAC3_BH11BAC3_02290 [soil metagenome]
MCFCILLIAEPIAMYGLFELPRPSGRVFIFYLLHGFSQICFWLKPSTIVPFITALKGSNSNGRSPPGQISFCFAFLQTGYAACVNLHKWHFTLYATKKAYSFKSNLAIPFVPAVQSVCRKIYI